MNTAEKRAELAARGEPWPTCDCHGEPVYWRTDQQHYRCAVTRREWRNAYRQKRKDAGTCVHCAGPLATATLCEDCAGRHADRQWEYEQAPERQLKKYLTNLKNTNKKRRAEGFQPTEAGMAALAAWMKGAGHDPSDD